MKGFFTSIIGWVLIVIIAVIIIAFIGWSRAPDILANNLAKMLKVSVEIDDLELSWNKITVDNLEIGNVRGGVLPKAFSAETIGVSAPLTNYLKKQIVIDEIAVDNVYLGLEFESARGTKGNWTIIMGNLKASEAEHPEPTGRSVFIKRLVINNIAVEVSYDQEGKIQRLPVIKQIVLTDINTEEGFPMEQLMDSVLGQMLKSVFIKQNLQNMLDNLIQNQAGDLNNLIQPFKGIFGK